MRRLDLEFMSTENISPTAHYTGYVWYRNNLGLQELSTDKGRLYYAIFKPADILVRAFMQGLSLEPYLLQRHVIIDHLLREDIRSGKVTQVIEIASGLSPRGYRFAGEFPQVQFIDTDLSEMNELKKEKLKNLPVLPNYRSVTIDVLKDNGNLSLNELAASLDQKQGTVVIAEGLISYFDTETATQIFRRVQEFLSKFSVGRFICEIHLKEHTQGSVVDIFKKVLGKFVDSKIDIPFDDQKHLFGILEKLKIKDNFLHDPANYSKLDKMPVVNRSSFVRILQSVVN